MRLSEFLIDVGVPVAYYPKLAISLDSVKAAILLCQFAYWSGKETHEDGWIYKSAADIKNETGLSYYEQKAARKILKKHRLVAEHYQRITHRLFFQLDLDALDAFWEKQSQGGTVKKARSRTLKKHIGEREKVTVANLIN